jgi:hypothetical protein
MKTIQPVTAWYNGQEVQATVLSATCFNDNLLDAASFQYQLMQEVPVPNPNPFSFYLEPVVQGYLNMTGETYQNWDTNDYAYAWVAEQLNLTITGDYVPPVPPTPVPPQPEPTPEVEETPEIEE